LRCRCHGGCIVGRLGGSVGGVQVLEKVGRRFSRRLTVVDEVDALEYEGV